MIEPWIVLTSSLVQAEVEPLLNSQSSNWSGSRRQQPGASDSSNQFPEWVLLFPGSILLKTIALHSREGAPSANGRSRQGSEYFPTFYRHDRAVETLICPVMKAHWEFVFPVVRAFL